MSTDLVQTVGKYAIAIVIIIGCFLQIRANTTIPGADNSAYVGLMGLIVGWVVRDSAGASAAANTVRTLAAASPAAPTA